jgi:hypothetical protein
MIEHFKRIRSTGSRMVSWFTVFEFVAPLLARLDSWPAAGTPEWCELDDEDPKKLAGVLEAGIHWSLRVDAEQTARAEASQDISAAADWSAVARTTRTGRGDAYIPRRAS